MGLFGLLLVCFLFKVAFVCVCCEVFGCGLFAIKLGRGVAYCVLIVCDLLLATSYWVVWFDDLSWVVLGG